MTLLEYVNLHGLGMSQLAIIEAWHGFCLGARKDRMPPQDVVDFRRCFEVIQAFPAAQDGLALLAEKHVAWAPYVERWELLSAAYAAEQGQGRCPLTWGMLQEAYEQSMIVQGYTLISPGYWKKNP